MGFIPAVTVNSTDVPVAYGDVIRSHATRAATVNTSVTPSMTIPEGDDQTVDSKTLTLNKYPFITGPGPLFEPFHL